MRKRVLLIVVLIFGLVVTQVFATNSFSSNNADVTWGSTWIHVDNHNSNGVIIYISVELSNGKIENIQQPIAGDTPWQWNVPGNITITENNNPAASSGVCCFGKVFASGFNTFLIAPRLPRIAGSWVLNPSHTIKSISVTLR